MKKFIIIAILLTFAAQAFANTENRMRRAVKKAAAMTDLHFCVMLSDGAKVTETVDAYLIDGLGCEDVLDRAKKFGATDEEIKEQILNSFKSSTLSKMKDCAEENFGKKGGCQDLLERADELNISDKEIREELGFLVHFL